MPIEIKELHIKAVIAPVKEEKDKTSSVSLSELQKLKKEIIRECMEKVFAKMQERMER